MRKSTVGSAPSVVDANGFDQGLLLLRTSVLEHARHEERYEFPLS